STDAIFGGSGFGVFFVSVSVGSWLGVEVSVTGADSSSPELRLLTTMPTTMAATITRPSTSHRKGLRVAAGSRSSVPAPSDEPLPPAAEPPPAEPPPPPEPAAAAASEPFDAAAAPAAPAAAAWPAAAPVAGPDRFDEFVVRASLCC